MSSLTNHPFNTSTIPAPLASLPDLPSFTTALPVQAATGFLSLVFLLALIYPNRYVGTESRPDLPGPRGLPLLGNLFQVLPYRTKTLQWMQNMFRKYGDVTTFTMPPWGRGILINRPEWLAHVKAQDNKGYSRGPVAVSIFSEFPGRKTPVASEGAEWKLARKHMSPIFTVKSFTDHVSSAMDDIISKTKVVLTQAAANNVEIDWNDLAGRIALSIFTQSALSLKSDSLRADIRCLDESDRLRDNLFILNQISSSRLLNPFWTWTEQLDGSSRKFKKARADVRYMVDELVTMRRRQFLKAQSKSSSSSSTTSPTPQPQKRDYLSILLTDPAYSEPLMIRDVLVTLLFAGRDNTQSSLAWSFYALQKHPKWIERMREEAGALSFSLNGEGRHGLAYADLWNYHVHLAVFYETVRMWPGLPKNARLALVDDVLPAIPEYNLPEVKVSKGDYIFWSDLYMMRSPEVWGPDANEFNPGRHLDSDGRFVKPTPPLFNGFGSGPRLCPAATLATYEFVACWAGLVSHFDFETRPDQKEPELVESFTPSLAYPLMVKVIARD